MLQKKSQKVAKKYACITCYYFTCKYSDYIKHLSALKHVANKNIKQIAEWTKVHPDYNDSDSKDNDRFLQIVSEAMSGSTQDETIKNYNKIIKNIVKETVIEKSSE